MAIVINKLDATVAALLGVVVMVWMGTMTEVEAAQLVDWNVMAILVGIWIIAGYFGRTGVPSWLSVQSLKLSGGKPGLLILVLSMLTGLLSMFIDNVVCILMMAPVALPLARALGIPATPLVLMIGFSANFMGTALLLGDLPPQMLHSVAGAEFFDFIWQHGRPSSFPILMLSFVITLAFMYVYGFRRIGKPSAEGAASVKSDIPDPLFATITVGMFLLTVLAMAMREALGVKLGFIALTGAVILVLTIEMLGERLKEAPSFEHIVQELDWRAVFFYIALFALVGGLEKTHILQMMADAMKPLFAQNYALGATLALLGDDPDRRAGRARRLHPDLPLHDQGSRRRRHPDLAAVVGGAVGGNARQQSHRRGRARALCGAAHRREGGGPQGLAARVPVVEPAVLPDQLARLLRARDADLGPALREMRNAMFKNILIPTDGSTLSQKAAAQGVALAKSVGAKVTAFFAAPPATPIIYRNNLPVGYATPAEHEEMIEKTAAKYLGFVERAAQEGGRRMREHSRHQRLSGGRDPEDREQEEVRSHRDGDARPGRPARRPRRQRHAEGAQPSRRFRCWSSAELDSNLPNASSLVSFGT